jgi:uncharacterized repeat protein (TIGR01451 family)
VTGLTNGQAYTFTVHATNDAGDGPESDPSAEVTPTAASGADLSIDTFVDTPDPVDAGNTVRYEAVVSNGGPEAVTGAFIDETLSSNATFDPDSSSPNCSLHEASTVHCDIGPLASGDTATVDIYVVSPSVTSDDTMNVDATAGSEASDPFPGNNSVSEATTVRPRATDSSDGFIAPDGGSIDDDTGPPGPDPNDPTVLRMRFGAGPGGEATLTEEQCPPELTPCIGQIGDFGPPDGYDSLVAVFLEDPSLVPSGTRRHDIDVFYNKPPDAEFHPLARCRGALVPPCVLQVKQLDAPTGPWRFRVLISSDPRLLPR